jgi:hypothetical protein
MKSRRSLIAAMAVCALCIHGSGAAGTPHAVAAGSNSQAPHALYTRSIQRLQSVPGLRFDETIHVLVQGPTVVRETLLYSAPVSVATLVQSKQASGKSLAITTVQVGTIVCQSPPSWTCFRHPRPHVVSLIQSLVQPKVLNLHYTSKTTEYTSGKTKYKAVAVNVQGTKQGALYKATLTVNAATELPLAFSSVVTNGGAVALRQSATFSYGLHFAIHLPHGKNVHLPK